MRMGSFWGSDFILSNPLLKNRTPINALSFVEILQLERDDFFQVRRRPADPSSKNVVSARDGEHARARVVVLYCVPARARVCIARTP
jgi:hypothetical protein